MTVISAHELRNAGRTRSIQWLGVNGSVPTSETQITLWLHEVCGRTFWSSYAEVNSHGCRKCQEEKFAHALRGSGRFDVA